jgi:hypothetical protein
MEYFACWLGTLTLAALMLAVLLINFWKHPGLLSRILLAYFVWGVFCILLKWAIRLDLAMYDAEKYHLLAAHIAGLLRDDFWGNLPLIITPYAAYTLPLGLTYFVFGPFEPTGQLLNTAVALGLLVQLHHLAHRWFGPQTARRSLWLLALYPYGWILATTLNRDMLILYCLAVWFRVLADVHHPGGITSRHRLYLTGCAAFVYMGLLRPPLLVLGALAVFIFWMTPAVRARGEQRLFRVAKLVFIVVILGMGSMTFLVYGKYYMATTRLEQEATQFSDVDNMNQRLKISENANSAYLQGVRYSSYIDTVRIMPEAILYFMFSPLPWQVKSFKQALGMVDSFWLMAVFWYFFKGIKILIRKTRKVGLSLLAYLALGIAISSVLQANVGSAMRHRTMFFLLMFPVAVEGLRQAWWRRLPRAAGRQAGRPGRMEGPAQGAPAPAAPTLSPLLLKGN